MIGAIIGDVVGSRYEFNNYRSKDFNLFDDKCTFTDDTIMTVAVMDYLLTGKLNKNNIIKKLKKYGRAYPSSYGCTFSWWLSSNSKEAYNSFGNGAAMRISPVGWYAKNEKEVKELSKIITEVTHSHPEGIKGAEVTAMCVYYARIGKSKEFIKKYVEQYYNLDFDYEELRKNYHFNETCQETVPQAIYCFLISNDFEDCLRTSISIGGDSDTLAAISCSIAEAYYKKVDKKIMDKIWSILPFEFLLIIKQFNDKIINKVKEGEKNGRKA